MRTTLATLLLASLFCAAFVPQSLAGTDVFGFAPRGGLFFDSLSSDQYLQAADVDEVSSIVPVPSDPSFVSIFPSGVGLPEFDLALVTEAPACLDCGDYAIAVAIFSDPVGLGIESSFVLDGFFQLRLAGSNAVVQNSSLAQAAVDGGLWTNVDNYIEFNPGNAIISAANASGPDAFSQFPFPEPSTLILLILGAGVVSCKRIRR